MKLKSFGCSFIFGSDLQDPNGAWPALLAQYYNLPYQCHAEPGSGNLRILESVLKALVDPEPAVYVIGWTWIDRFDYADPATDQWCSVLPADSTDQARYYYRHFHSQYRDKLSTLIHIKTAQDAVLAAGHRLIMTHMDDLIFETAWHCSPAVTQLQSSIVPNIIKFENQTFLNWARKNGHEISVTWHPLESAHRAAADLMINYNLV
jgi:hypothetical protein